MSYGIIYKVTNKVNEKCYIGQTSQSLTRRKNSHRSESKNTRYKSIFHAALKKYKEESFDWEILCECDDLKELNDKEIYYIEYYDTYNNGYNLTLGGGGSTGFKHSEETKNKLSFLHKGKKSYWYGKHHSNETKIKISKAISGKNHYNYGRTFSEETCRRISESKKGFKYSLESRIKMSEAHIGKNLGIKHSGAKKYVITTPDNEDFVIHGLIDFCRKYKNIKLNYKNLSQCATGEKNHHKGYKCRYYIEEYDNYIKFWVYEENN